jgi:hypothetical protein
MVPCANAIAFRISEAGSDWPTPWDVGENIYLSQSGSHLLGSSTVDRLLLHKAVIDAIEKAALGFAFLIGINVEGPDDYQSPHAKRQPKHSDRKVAYFH